MKKLFIITLAALACSAWADRIDLKSGSFLTGTVKSVTKDAVVFTSDDFGDVTIKVANIVKLDAGKHVVQHNDLTEETKALVVEKGAYVAEAKPLDMGDVKAIDPVPEKWHGSITVAYNATRGNSYENTATVLANVNRRWEDDRFRGDFGYYYGESAQSGEDARKTTDKWEVELQHDHFWLPKVYNYENAKWERDMIQQLRARYRLGVGAGYQWLENRVFETTGTWSFNQEIGLNWVREDYEDNPDPKDSGYCALRYAHHLNWVPVWIDKINVFHNAEILPDVGDWEKYLVKADVGFSAPLAYDWTLNVKMEWEFDSMPASDRRKNDMRYIVGLGYQW